MIASNLKTNDLSHSMGIDPGRVVLSWIPVGGMYQSAFQVALAYDGQAVFDSGKVMSSEARYLLPLEIPSKTQVTWSVTLWDEADSLGEAVCMEFETGLAENDWEAQWIDPELNSPEYSERARYGAPLNVASYLRKEFDLANFEKARLYITAHGVYDVWVNGQHIDGYYMAPGTSDYDHRIQVQTYDVARELHEGRNEILVSIGEGWWRGSHGWSMRRYCFGTDLALLCQLEIDGRVAVRSDDTWQASQNGPLQENDTMRLERYDAQKEISDWHSVKQADFGYGMLVGTCLPITPHEQFSATLLTTPNGQKLLDFGQNFAGYVQLDLVAKGGEKIVLTHGEVLDKDGNFQNENFQNPDSPLCRQRIEYTCKAGRNLYHQTKCYYGFRYVLVETELEITGEEFTGVAVYSDMEQISFFTCGNAEVNRLFQNILWSMKSNFLDIPTDCPHREKLGFTGDCQVFTEAALYLMDSYPVLERWLREVASAQYEDGCIPQVVPRKEAKPSKFGVGNDGSAGWCDAFQLVPYYMMKRLNSPRLVEELYPAIKRWMLYNLERAKQTRPENENIPQEFRDYILDTATNWGEWCEPGRAPVDYAEEGKATGHAEIATAFLAQGCLLMQEMAERQGLCEDAEFFRDAYEKTKAAYRYLYVKNGRIESERQCHFVRPIAHELLTEEEKKTAAEDLVTLIRNNGNKIGTGFLTTCYLCNVLTDWGYSSVAYDLLLQTEQPSWLYEVRQGATTIWESWFGIDKDGIPEGSHNHYSFGAVSAWMMSRVLGIVVADGTITLRPYPDRRLGFAKGSYLSPLGEISSAWKYEGDEILYTFEVPCNSNATVILPDGQTCKVAPGIHTFRTTA
ncbi:MAG: family 78 glycoside hydrolase catalytic domain [Clostridia bacterium]|nr:family 78 glycoside hydrolase catalytic domain [Clostridia bacterium]